MKDLLILKLYNNPEELEADELVYLANIIRDAKRESPHPYDHNAKDVFTAIGWDKDEAKKKKNELNRIFRGEVKDMKTVSEKVEQAERILSQDQMATRLFIMEFLRMTKRLNPSGFDVSS